jgi:hypothetical protein
MKKRLGSKKFKDAPVTGKKRELSTSESRKRYEDERPHLKEVSQRATAFSQSITDSVSLGKRFSGSLLEWGGTTETPLNTTLALVASFQTALGDLQLKISDMLEEKLNGPLRDMSLLERELLNASKKDEVFRSEEMKVETFRMSLVEKFCEYMDSYADYFKRGALLLNNYQEEVSKTKSASRRQVEEILNSTLEVDAEVAAEEAAQMPPPPIFGTALIETLKLDQTDIPRIVLHIIAYLDHTALTQMGIFRISGHSGSVQALKEAIDSGHEVDLTLLNNAHVAATLFKLYLRTLPDTLTIQSRFDEWIQVVADCDLSALSPRSPAASPSTPTTPPDLEMPLKLSSPSPSSSTLPQFPENVIRALTALVDSLPLPNARTLDYLIAFCTRVVAHSDQNMMGAKNLASLIAPNILSRAADAGIVNPQVMLEDVSKSNKIVECMIMHYEIIFANVDYPLKSQPVESLASLASEYPLCADRSVKHGSSVIVDLPPDETPAAESGAGSPKTEELRKRAVKKKTVSSLSLIKDRKLKKKEKVQSDRQTILVGESDFKVPPTNTASLRPLSPRSANDHSRTASEVVSSSSMTESASHSNIVGASSLSDQDGLLRTSSSPPSSFSEDEWRPSLSRSHGSASGESSHPQQKPLSPATSATDVPSSNGKDGAAGKSHLSSPTKDSKEAKEARKRDRKSSKPRRPSEVGSKRTSSNAPANTSSTLVASSSQNASSSIPSGAAGDTSESISAYDSATEVPQPAIAVTPTRTARRHSITLASGEGLDPTKENFGSIGPSAALGLVQSPAASTLSVDALVDDQSGSMRIRANSRRGSVLTNPYAPLPGRSGSVSQRDRLLTPTKLRYPSPTTSSANTSMGSAAVGAKKATSEILPGLSASPPPFSPSLKETKKGPKDRTSALTTVKFENSEEFNKVMDEHFGKGPTASYVVLGYTPTGAIRMLAGGVGGVDDMVSHLKDEEIQYGLIRITYYEDGNPLTRDVFVQWNGPKVSAIQKGIKKAHCGEVKNALCPTAIEILASSKTNFTLETLLARSAPTAARVID